MIETQEIDTNVLEKAFYAKDFYFSYSSLNRLMTAPNIFYKEYVLRQKEIKTDKYLLEGTLIHYLLLEQLNFDDHFLVTPESLPSANSMKVANEVFKLYEEKLKEDETNSDLELVDFEEDVLKILEEMDLHQKVGKDKRAAKVIEIKTEEYFRYLKKKGQREIIDSGTLDKCTRAAEIIKANPKIRELLGMDLVSDGVNFGVYNELKLQKELEGSPFGLQGILDNMVVDVQAKTVRINDFKTTGKSLVEFQDSVEYWNYWLQAVIYLMLAMEYLKSVIDDTWKFEIRFVVYDSHGQVYAFPVSNESLVKWMARYNQTMQEAEFHYTSKDFSLPYNFIVGEVKL